MTYAAVKTDAAFIFIFFKDYGRIKEVIGSYKSMNILSILSGIFKKKKTSNLISCYPEAFLIVSMAGEILYANDKLLRMFDVSEDELFNLELLDIFDGGFNLINDLIAGDDSAIVRSKLKMDEDLFFEIKTSSFEDGEEKIVITVRDVTKTQKMLNKLMFEHEYLNKLTKNKNTFLTKISGELTSPIHSINGFSQAILEGLGGDVNEKQNKYLNIINKNSTQLLDLVNSLVEYSKLESGLYDYEFKNFDFVNMMTTLFAELLSKADAKKLILNFDLNSLGKRNFYSDENVLKKVIILLVENAISLTDSGSVQVVVSHPDSEFLEIAGFNVAPNLPDKTYVMIKVNDTGMGFQEADLQNIFDPYANIDKYIAKKAVTKSLSLGIVYNLVRILKGRMWAESESMKGSSFCFIIPIEKLSL